MNTKTVCEMHTEFKAQGVPKEHLAFVCPMCGTVQSCQSLIKAGAGKTVATGNTAEMLKRYQ